MALAERLVEIRERIAAASARAGRPPGDVRIVAVSKTFSAQDVQTAAALGLSDFGENRVQEAAEKVPLVGPGPVWHLVGHLQSNKAKRAVDLFSWIHSLDSSGIARELSKRAQQSAKTLNVLVELNLSGEPAKTGLEPRALDAVLAAVRGLPGLDAAGLMTMGPLSGGADAARRCFAELRGLLETARAKHGLAPSFRELSMGMSDDFEVAVEEGATMVRIGRALFGLREA